MTTNLTEVKRGCADLKASGFQMYYETMGKGKPVIFIYQSWWNNFEFEKVLPLVAKKYRVFFPDTLGFGFSPPAPWDWEFEQLCDSFIEFMDALSIDKASFGPHSGAGLLLLQSHFHFQCDRKPHFQRAQ